MKILLVTNFAPDRQESMLRFGRMLADGLPALGIETVVTSPPRRLTRHLASYHYSGGPKYLGYLDKFGLFPWQLRREIARHRPDVVHIMDHANSAYAQAARGRPVVVTCHDLLEIRAANGEFAQRQVGRSGRAFQRWILRHLAKAPEVVCVSEKTRGDLLRFTRRSIATTRVIYPGLNYPYQPVPAARALDRLRAVLPGPDGPRPEYFLNVGGGQWYKNRPGLLRIFAEIMRRETQPVALVLVGKPLSADDATLARQWGITPRLRQLSEVSSEDLAALYSHARGLIFPSWEEGFGWPIAEAQACGCPVFTTAHAPMSEVGGNGALYFDPSRPADAAGRIVAARDQTARLRREGFARAALWSTRRMLEEYAALYRRLAASHENTPRH